MTKSVWKQYIKLIKHNLNNIEKLLNNYSKDLDINTGWNVRLADELKDIIQKN